MDRTVSVTGDSGTLGRAVVAARIHQRWTVINFDRVPPRTVAPVSSAPISPATVRSSRHSPASTRFTVVSTPSSIWPPSPAGTFAPNVATFDNNPVSTFQVFQAAKLFNIHNLVWASCLGVQRDAARLPFQKSSRIRSAGRRCPG